MPLAVARTATQHYSNTTLANDAVLVLATAANATYQVEGELFFDGAHSPGDLKFGLTVPASATFTWGFLNFPATVGTGNLTLNSLTAASSGTIACAGAGTVVTAMIWGTYVTSSTAGNLQLQFAQGTSSATDTIMDSGSRLIAWRIG